MTTYNQHSEPTRPIATLTLLLFFCISGTVAHAAQKGGWQAENLEATIVSQIRGERETKNGNIVEVKVRVTPSDASSRDMKTKEMILKGKSTANNAAWRRETVGIGIVGNNGKCFYQFPQALIKGAESISTATSGEFKLSREKEGAPTVVSLVKSPTHICLAFIVPEGGSEKVTLHLATNRFSLPVFNK